MNAAAIAGNLNPSDHTHSIRSVKADRWKD